LDVGDEPLCGYERRMDAQFDAVRRAPGDPEELDPVAELLGIAQVLARQLRDALGVRLVELHRHAERNRRHDRQLVCSIDAVDIERRVGFSVDARDSRIVDRMKFDVPLMMPAIHSMRFAVNPSRSALMIGTPPATAPSNATITPFACAAAKISLPRSARSALLAV